MSIFFTFFYFRIRTAEDVIFNPIFNFSGSSNIGKSSDLEKRQKVLTGVQDESGDLVKKNVFWKKIKDF